MKKKVLFIFVLFSFVFFGVTERPQLYANDPIDWEESDIEEKTGYHKKTCGCNGVAFHYWKVCCCPGYAETCEGQCNGKMYHC